MKKVLAVASGGGHWIQLQRLTPAFEGTALTFMSTNADYAKELKHPLITVKDANMWDKPALLIMFMQVFWQVLKLRPDVVITTGAAPGFAAILFGRLLGARTLWIDSIANSEELSSSGRQARKIAHQTVTQWQHLSEGDGPEYWGAVL